MVPNPNMLIHHPLKHVLGKPGVSTFGLGKCLLVYPGVDPLAVSPDTAHQFSKHAIAQLRYTIKQGFPQWDHSIQDK